MLLSTKPVVVAPKDRMTSKFFSRKKATIPRLIQVQECKPTSRNEVTISCPPLQTESKLQSEKTIDQNLPIPIRKRTRECIKRHLHPLSHVVHLKSFHNPIRVLLGV
ncbi:hypothetical protein AAG906_014337 [Vitis piasezkii]|uniref:Uncharacterized protein n=1 Tax=Vitis vinifera TaxID=29760 RepID=A0A438D2Z5_VITVI|nr:hypothetical protein CK203_087366 [Vitis vinifera]